MDDALLKKALVAVYRKHVVSETGCWIASTRDGTVTIDRKDYVLSRLSYEVHFGPLPNGANVFRRCGVAGCVNPDHIFVKTRNPRPKRESKKYWCIICGKPAESSSHKTCGDADCKSRLRYMITYAAGVASGAARRRKGKL